MNKYIVNIGGQSKTFRVCGASPREAFETMQNKLFPYPVDLIPTTRGKGEVRMELVGGSRASVSFYKVKRRASSVKKKAPGIELKVPIAGKGTFEIARCNDPCYPGVDVEFRPKNIKDFGGTLPRIVFEYPTEGQLVLHVWADKNSEDPTHKIYFE